MSGCVADVDASEHAGMAGIDDVSLDERIRCRRREREVELEMLSLFSSGGC